jgi:iron complex transport system ATP-binding protein
MVLHDLNHAIMFSDYLVAIKNGKMHSAGSPETVITPEILLEVFNVEAEIILHPVLGIPVCLPYGVGGHDGHPNRLRRNESILT